VGLIAGGVLYYSYVQDREVSLSKHHFRSLDTIGKSLSEETKAFEKIIEAAGATLRGDGKPPSYEPSLRDQRCFSNPFVRVTGTKQEIRETHRKTLEEHKPFFAFLCASSKLSEVFITLDIKDTVSLPLTLFQRQKNNEAVGLAIEEGYEFKLLANDSLSLVPAPSDEEKDFHRYLVTAEINGGRGLRLEKGLPHRLSGCDDCRATLHARFELQPILDEIVPIETFSDVLVADEQGNVIVHGSDKERSAETRLELLSRLLRTEAEATRGAATPPVDSGPLAGSLWEQLPLQKKVRVGESEYYLYALAVPIDSWRYDWTKGTTGKAGRLKLIVAGLVPMSEVMLQALAIPHGVSLTLIFLSFALTFTLPLIKLATMGPRDRLGLPDALGCMLFAMMGAALITFTIGSWALHNNVRSTADAKLQPAAQAIQRNVERELRGLLARLEGLAEGRDGWSGTGECVSINLNQRQHNACFGKTFNWSDWPLIHTVIWVDPLGEIRSLATNRRTSILTRNIKGRPYIQSVWSGDLRYLKPTNGQTDKSFGFTIMPSYVWDDGEFGTMLAAQAKFPSVTILGEGAGYLSNDYIVAIRTRMESLVGTVVPVGYGYAVIDMEGAVLYASEKSRNLRENLFSETDHDVQLKSLVNGKTTGTIRVIYRGRAHVMRVTRLLEPLPWTLIVYRDTRWLDWVTDQALFFGVALFTCYSFVILLGGLFVLVIFQSVRSGEAGWMWPAQGRVHTYYGLIMLNFFVMVLAVVITWSLGSNHPGWVLLAAVGLSSTAMGLTVWILKQSNGTGARDKHGALRIETNWAYSVLATTAILLMAAMPSGVFLTVGFQRALSLYESYTIQTLYRNVEDSTRERQQWYQRVLPSTQFDAMKSLSAPAQCPGCCACLKGTNTRQASLYWEFLLDCPVAVSANPLEQPTFPQSLNDMMRVLLHLWMWDPGRKLGGWLANQNKAEHGAPPFMLFASNTFQPWLITIGLFAGIVSILWYMRLCEDPDEKYRKITVAIMVGIVGFILLLYFIEDENPDSLHERAFRFALYTGLGSMLVTAATYGSQRLVCHYLFLMDFAVPLTNSRTDDRRTSQVLIVVPPAKDPLTSLDRLKWKVLPIPTLLADYQESDNPWPDYVTDETHPLVIAGFDHRLSERHQALRMLNLIERLAQQPNRPILVVSHRHPFDSEIVSFESSNIPVQDRSAVLSRDRWAAAFKNFLVIPYSGFRERDDQMVMINAIMRDPASLMHESWVNWVKNRTIHVDEESQTEARYALGVLRCRYEYWWADCSPSEKLALWHVATDRFLHASNSKLYPLLWKGLLKLAPDIQLYSRSWQLFVKQAGDRDQLAFLKPDLKPSTWAKVSRPLLLGLFSAVVFLAVTQENVREVIIALIPVLPVFLVEIPRLLSGGIRSVISRDA